MKQFFNEQLAGGKIGEGGKRIEWLDTLRVFACFLVVLTHSAMSGDESDGVYLAMVSFIGSPSSELFLTVSGAILLPVKTDFRSFYRKRFGKLYPPVIFWSLICILVYVGIGRESIQEGLASLLSLPFYPVVGVYWFLYVMIGLYLFAPFISFWLRQSSKRQVEFFLFLWLINMALPYANILIPGFFDSTDGNHYWELNQFAGFLGYWLLGYYLRKYPVKIGFNLRWIAIITGFVSYVLVLAYLRYSGSEVALYFGNLQIGSACFVALIFVVVQSFPIKSVLVNRVIRQIALCSFGVYLIHILIVREVIWLFFEQVEMNPAFEAFSIAVISLIVCCAIVKILSFSRITKKLVGM